MLTAQGTGTDRCAEEAGGSPCPSVAALALALAGLLCGSCLHIGALPRKDDCGDRAKSAKQPPWLDVDKHAAVDLEALRGALRDEGALGVDDVPHAWVGVDGDGTVFCTRASRGDLPEHKYRALRRALEKAPYAAAVVLGRPHFTYLHVEVPLWSDSDEDACRRGVKAACAFASSSAAKRGDRTAQLAFDLKGCELGHMGMCADAGAAIARGHGTRRDLARGRALMTQACEASPWFCSRLAWSFRDDGEIPDDARSLELFYRACEAKNGNACRMVGDYLQTGRGGAEVDAARATAMYDEACARGSMRGCSQYARRLRRGIGVAADGKRAMHMLERLCARDGEFCNDIGNILLVEETTAAAIPWYQRACHHTNGDDKTEGCLKLLKLSARYDVGLIDVRQLLHVETKMCSERGFHCSTAGDIVGAFVTSPSPKRAREFYERGCEFNGAESCASLPRVLLDAGETAKARVTAQKSCLMGAAESCDLLEKLGTPADGIAFREQACARKADCTSLAWALARRGGPGDAERALALAQAACEANAHGCHTLGRVVALVGDPATREAQAAAHLRAACDKGDGEACIELAARYRTGGGVTVDVAKARALELRGCDLDFEQCAAYEARRAQEAGATAAPMVSR